VATHQDLSGYFFARCVELYLQGGGLIAFVMPYAALNRRQFEGFRLLCSTNSGWRKQAPRGAKPLGEARIEIAWAFDEHLQPLFPVPSCVLFARKRSAARLPDTAEFARGNLPRRDAIPAEAALNLTWSTESWPQAPKLEGGSTYREAFRQGATMVPRMLCVVERVSGGIGGSASALVVRSRRTTQEKEPWKSLPPMQASVEATFIRPLFLGESIAPYRDLGAELAVVPWDEGQKVLLDASTARAAGWPKLAAWMGEAESVWAKNGAGKLELLQRWDYNHELRAQFPIAPLRVLYSASGSIPAACLLRDSSAVMEHKLYWAALTDETEARYLIAILNSETARARVSQMQSKGQWGARDFDKVMFELTIPKFDRSLPMHRELADAAGRAEQVAAAVALPEKGGFHAARRAIREALAADGIGERIDQLVAALLDSQP
jgi:hypothetical protein